MLNTASAPEALWPVLLLPSARTPVPLLAVITHCHNLHRGVQGGPPFAVSPELYDELLPPAGELHKSSLTDACRFPHRLLPWSKLIQHLLRRVREDAAGKGRRGGQPRPAEGQGVAGVLAARLKHASAPADTFCR